MIADPLVRALDVTTDAIRSRCDAHWIVAFSGGKDSSAVLKIFAAAYRRAQPVSSRVTVVYCDTGVENPILDGYVASVFSQLKEELPAIQLPFALRRLRAPIQDRFFVRIIGRGYPPPTNSFRWCTQSLRIRPVSDFIEKQDNTIVVLGMRLSESEQRSRVIRVGESLYWQKQREGKGSYDLFLPIVELDIAHVWDALFWLPAPRSIKPYQLEELYRGASGECPIIRSPQSAPCASGRFGCWTCTVVRRDRSAIELIRSGHTGLAPFLEFRDWLAEFRNDPRNRWQHRRNGGAGLGPFTIEARKTILDRLNRLEERTATTILEPDERGIIASLWEMDHFPRISFKAASKRPSDWIEA